MNREIKPETSGEERREGGGSSAAGGPPPRAPGSALPAEGAPRPARPQAKPKRTSPATYLREVRGELRRVAWPSAKEVRSYSLVVLVVVTLLMFYVFLLDQGIGQVVFQIFG